MKLILQIAAGVMLGYIGMTFTTAFILVPLAKFLVTAVGVGV